MRMADGNAIADATDGVPGSAFAGSTHFGVAMGTTGGEGAISFSGSPWINQANAQADIFRGIPSTGIVVAQRTNAQNNDPVTATFAAASTTNAPPAPGAYSGAVRVVVSAI